MRKFLAFIMLAVPFISFAQSAGPQMQITNLQTNEVSYHVGQEISGSFVMNNIGDENIPDVQYYVAVGNFGEEGGFLDNETAVTPLSEALYLPQAARLEVPFSINPANLPDGEVGLHVVATQKNGMLLGWSKVPLKFEGERPASATPLIKGYFALDGDTYALDSNAPFGSDEIPSFQIELPEGAEDGMRDVKLTIFEKTIGQERVYDQVVSVDFIDGVGTVLLPDNLKPKSYAGQVSLANGSNVLTLRYSISGPQAEVLSIDTDMFSLRKGDDYVVSLSYADTPLNARDPEATEYPDQLSVRLKVLNEKGEVVSQLERPLEVTQKQELLIVDENSTEEEQAEATERLDKMFNNEKAIDLPLVAEAKAKNLSFEVELYNPGTGEVYDTYKTSFPAAEGGYPARGVLLATFAIVLILLIVIFKKAKHKIPMVCLTLVLGAAVSAGVLVDSAQAYKPAAGQEKGAFNSHEIVFNAPISSRTAGYDQNVTIPLEVTATAKSWSSNGFLAHYLRYPIYTSGWATLSSPSAALTFAKNNHKNSSVYHVELKNGTFQKYISVGPYYYASNGGAQSPTLTPGKHYIPVSSTFCTSSHGCSKPSYATWELCVNGMGVCPGEETVDMCANIAGDQATVPEGKVQDGNNCVDNICTFPDAGEPCGCDPDNMGTWQCDGSCSASLSCSDDLTVSCQGAPSTITSPQTVNFFASVSNGVSPYSYNWGGGPDSAMHSAYINAPGMLQNVEVTDSNGLKGDASCSVAYNDTSCTTTKPNECAICQSGTWVGACAETTVTASFRFEPNIVSSAGQCRLVMNAENATSCRLIRTSTGQPITPVVGDTNADGTVSLTASDDYEVGVGTYRLECQGIDEGDVYESTGLPAQQCVATPDIIEN